MNGTTLEKGEIVSIPYDSIVSLTRPPGSESSSVGTVAFQCLVLPQGTPMSSLPHEFRPIPTASTAAPGGPGGRQTGDGPTLAVPDATASGCYSVIAQAVWLEFFFASTGVRPLVSHSPRFQSGW